MSKLLILIMFFSCNLVFSKSPSCHVVRNSSGTYDVYYSSKYTDYQDVILSRNCGKGSSCVLKGDDPTITCNGRVVKFTHVELQNHIKQMTYSEE